MSDLRILSATLADEAALARVARIMGSQSTSQAVIDELGRRRADGETVFAYDVVTAKGRIVLVGPSVDEDPLAVTQAG